jgi:twinkle protein
MKKEDFHHEKPRYYATDFPEIMEKIPQEKRNLYPKYELLHNGSAQKASADDNATNGFTNSESSELSDNSGNPELFGFSGNPELSDNSGSSEEQPVTLKELQKTTTDAIQLITKGRLDVQVTCPKCGSHRCFVKRSNGYFHCWICNNGGILEEMKTLNHPESSRIDGAYYARASTQKSSRQKDKNYVPMVSSDYKEINEEVRSWLYPLYPFDSEEEHQQFLEHFHSPQLAITCPKARPLLQPKEIETLQNQVKSYVQAMKLDPEVMKRTGVMCAYMHKKADDGKSEDPHGCIPVPAIAYCNYLDGKIINVKFRSVVLNPITSRMSGSCWCRS